MADESIEAQQPGEAAVTDKAATPTPPVDLEAIAARAGGSADGTVAPTSAQPAPRSIGSVDDLSSAEQEALKASWLNPEVSRRVNAAKEKWQEQAESHMAPADPEGFAPSNSPGADPVYQALRAEMDQLKAARVQDTAASSMRQFLHKHELTDEQKGAMGNALQGIADGTDRVFSPETVYTVDGIEMLAKAHGVFDVAGTPGAGNTPWTPTPGLEQVTPDMDPLKAGVEGIAKVHHDAEVEVFKNLQNAFGLGGNVTLGGAVSGDIEI